MIRIWPFGRPEDRDVPRPPRTAGAEVRRTVCTFCSCGCGILAHVRDGRVLFLEGDPANPINEGTLCAKGAAAAELHRTGERVLRPLHREPRAREWKEVSWDYALGRIAAKMKEERDRAWVPAARRTDGLAFWGGAINTNEEAYAWKKMATALGSYYVEHQARI